MNKSVQTTGIPHAVKTPKCLKSFWSCLVAQKKTLSNCGLTKVEVYYPHVKGILN